MEKEVEENKGRNEKGQFIEGNTLCIGNGGRPLIFPTLEAFENACKSYFEWADANPWIKNDVVRGGDAAGTPLQIPTQRPYTLIALCHHIGITKTCFKDYETRTEFVDLCTRMRDKIDNQQIEGSLVGLFNANLTARIQGLVDEKHIKSENTNRNIGYDIDDGEA
jgi:DNA-packaging protein gp3